MTDIYAFRPAPTYSPLTKEQFFNDAMDQPLNIASTFFNQAEGGALESFGLGTVLRDYLLPQEAPQQPGLTTTGPNGETITLPDTPQMRRRSVVQGVPLSQETPQQFQQRRDEAGALTEDQYKASPWYRDSIPWDKGMTTMRAAALATMDDANKVREFYASKRPITAFFGGLFGQALDPINYVPVGGPLVKAAALARFGRIGGEAATAAFDAATNTALFGLATSGERARFGDDVSWQSTISQIATAALIGGAFGTLSGAVGSRVDARAAREAEQRLATLRTTQEARVALNEGIDALVRGEDVSLTPNATEPVTRIARDAAPIVRRSGEVDRSWAGAEVAGQNVVTPTGLRIAVKPEIVDAADLVKASGDLQPRDRSRAASDAQIAEMAANLDPARLMVSPEADRGAPIVGPDNVVESGNGRVAALVRAAEKNPERFAAYKQALRDAGYDVPDKGVPILISRRTSDLTPDQRTQFVNDANTSAIARMSATETALMDVRAMTGPVLGNYVPGDVNSAANRSFVGSFLKNLPANERLSLVDARGHLNADGVRRVENALIAAAYGDPDVVARFAETPDDNVKAVMGAMSDAAGDWAAMRRELAQGLIDANFDVTANLTDALRFLSRAREKALAEKRPVATVIKEELGQIDMLAGEIDPRTKAFVQSFYKNDQFTQANGRDILAEHLSNIVRAARDLGKPQLFGDATAVAPSEMISNARPQARQADIFGDAGSGDGRTGNGEVGQVGALRGTGEADRSLFAEVNRTVGLDTTKARPEPLPEGRKQAETRIAKPDDAKALATQFNVDPATGAIPEEADLAQLAAEGRMTEADTQAMADAQADVEIGDAYAEALKSVAGCLL